MKQLEFEEATDHPLSAVFSKPNQSKRPSLSSHTSLEDVKISTSIIRNSSSTWIDPLSAALADRSPTKEPVTFKPPKKGYLENDFENWETLLTSVSNKSIALIKSIRKRALLNEVYAQSNHAATALAFIQNSANLKSDLIEAWQSNSRVKALRTISLVAKNLDDIERFDLYACKFMLSSKMLDEFSELVYRRIEEKSRESEDIEVAKETCRNWSLKICSIQELLPRLYLEIATLNTFGSFYVYDSPDKSVATIQRLIESVRGVGDPFIATFVHVYLCKAILAIFPDRKELFFQIYSDLLLRINQIKQIEASLPEFLVRFDLAKPNETCPYTNYTQFYAMPLDWILRCLLYKSSYQLSEQVYKELNVRLANYQALDLFFIIFNLMLPKLNGPFVVENHRFIIELIKTVQSQNTNSNLPKYRLISNLAAVFLANDSTAAKIAPDSKLDLFREIWKLIKRLNEREYIICTNAWIDFAIRHFNMSQISSILNNIIKHVISRKEFVNCNEDLIQVLVKILNSSSIDFQQFLTSDIVVPFIEMFQRESAKVAACKAVVEHLIKSVRKSEDSLSYGDSDYMTILIHLNKTMHDSVDQITSEEERKELSNLVNEFIGLVQFDSHTDQLDFYVQCRSNFSNFNNVIIQLVFNANRLSLDYCNAEENRNDLESSSFLKACLAFACITIPSVDSEACRAMLYLNTAQIALRCSFIEQTEFFVRSAISTLDLVDYEKCTKSTELFYVGYIKSLISFLVLVPDDLSRGYLFLFKKLLKTVVQAKFRQTVDHRVSIYLSMLNFLSTMAQPVYPYHLENSKLADEEAVLQFLLFPRVN